jgi:hypothetical protein
MSKFRKKPVVINAVKWNGATIGLTNGLERFNTERLEMPEWLPPVSRHITDIKAPGIPAPGEIWRDDDDLWIGTLEGAMLCRPGDWIIRGIKGELYPCKPDIFEATYERVGTESEL